MSLVRCNTFFFNFGRVPKVGNFGWHSYHSNGEPTRVSSHIMPCETLAPPLDLELLLVKYSPVAYQHFTVRAYYM